MFPNIRHRQALHLKDLPEEEEAVEAEEEVEEVEEEPEGLLEEVEEGFLMEELEAPRPILEGSPVPKSPHQFNHLTRKD